MVKCFLALFGPNKILAFPGTWGGQWGCNGGVSFDVPTEEARSPKETSDPLNIFGYGQTEYAGGFVRVWGYSIWANNKAQGLYFFAGDSALIHIQYEAYLVQKGESLIQVCKVLREACRVEHNIV